MRKFFTFAGVKQALCSLSVFNFVFQKLFKLFNVMNVYRNTPIEHFAGSRGISVRALNVCRSNGILTLGDLLNCDPDALHSLRNCGAKSAAELNALRQNTSRPLPICLPISSVAACTNHSCGRKVVLMMKRP